MKTNLKINALLGGVLAASFLAGSAYVPSANAEDWPTWGKNETRNMVSDEKGLPIDIELGTKKAGTDEVDLSTTKNVAWIAKLGSQSYGTPNIAGGFVYVGTNNESPRNKGHIGDRGVVMAFDEYTGAFKWQMISPKLGAGKVSDWEYLGMCSTPTVVGTKGYVVTNRCEVVCIDLNGMSDGNQGFQDEAKYTATADKDGKIVEPEIGATDADILWVYDMRKELGVFPHNIASNYPLVYEGNVYVATSNGVDWSHTNIPAPTAPSFLCLSADKGEYVAEMAAEAQVSENIMHCNWSSPTVAMVNGKAQIIFAAGDGWVYGMGTAADKVKVDDEISELPILWKYNACPKEYRVDENGEKRKYAEYDGPSELISTPVIHDGLIYVSIGQDPEHGEGVGMMSCIDPTGTGDLTDKPVWTFRDIERTISTPAVKDGLVYMSDYTGRLFCLEAKTGKQVWKYDTKGHIWSSPLLADGKIFLGNEEGELFILAEGRELKVLKEIEFPAALKGSLVAANGALFLATDTHLYCFKEGAKPVEN
ncbi:MAG: PQQ-binding-like beta-propeller repeat protein [Verrucomicrobiales bacterium]|nr:PQQ-binding-like beta-propeller repeat protein [Verrucomicrobiales bacterium]MCP5560480.1 PQQ-binding-like beta-propeller repeat protein [Verrucomicrobiaceae bacterium]